MLEGRRRGMWIGHRENGGIGIEEEGGKEIRVQII
jgi:hypothetical protein